MISPILKLRNMALRSLPIGLVSRTSHISRITSLIQNRFSSSKRWQARQLRDQFSREASVQGLKSRAAFKLLQIDERYRIFKSGQTVVDLGYAPGSWSQVALTRTEPHGRVLGVDIIPSQPPKGVSTIQGNFLNPEVQSYVREFVRDTQRGRPYSQGVSQHTDIPEKIIQSVLEANSAGHHKGNGEPESVHNDVSDTQRTVDLVLSDMMMNTSGITFKDHAGSMDLCRAALLFSYEVLKSGGHFVCKFYQGSEDKDLEKQLKALFQKVHRLKPESSRSESKETFFIALDRKPHAKKEEVFPPI
ncbi:FtsJ-like methyltransferase-domain-containing protein [Aspergillus californicus]